MTDIRFSVDEHPLTVIEADGALIEPTVVAGVTLAVAQRYSVLLTTGETGGAFWMRSTLSLGNFSYTVPREDLHIKGIIRCEHVVR